MIPRAGSAFDPESAAAQKVLREIGVAGGFVRAGAAGRRRARGVLVAHAASLPISASELRRRVREGRSLAYPHAAGGDRLHPRRTASTARSARDGAPVRRAQGVSGRPAPRSTRRRSTSSCSTCRGCRASPTTSSSAAAAPPRTLDTIAEAIRGELQARRASRPLHAEGSAESGWVLLDYGDVLMHVFLEDTRAYYALERLWGDAPLVPVDGA